MVWIALIYPVMSGVSMIAYLLDKRYAESGTWRISESTLLSFDLLGGWPGGGAAQYQLRHKISKDSYQQTYRAILWIHIMGWFGGLGFWAVYS